MGESQPGDAPKDPSARVRELLGDLYTTAERILDEVEAIAKQESERLGEDSFQGNAWDAYGDLGLFSDVGRARMNIYREIAALRGYLTIRTLDTSHKEYEQALAEANEEYEKRQQ